MTFIPDSTYIALWNILSSDGMVLQCLSDDLRDNEDLVMTAVTWDIDALQYASDRLRDNKGFILNLVRNNRNAYQYASPRLQQDSEVMDAIA